MPASVEPAALYEGIVAGQRRALARAITFAESSRVDHQAIAHDVIERSLPSESVVPRIGISGTPGVGKSTFIEALGMHLLQLGHRPAVISVDPSSKVTGGSILGDKTRMPNLSASTDAFIRPSASGGVLGGVAASTDDVILLCEAAGYGPILLETVGTGQSETTVDSLTDLFVVLVAPGGGDDLQGIKRGIMELIDVLVVNKADGPRAPEAETTVAAYRSALTLMRPKHPGIPTSVMSCSALEQRKIGEVWSTIDRRWNTMEASEVLQQRRLHQRQSLVVERARRALVERIAPTFNELADRHSNAIDGGTRSPAAIAAEIADAAVAELTRHE